MTQPKEWWIKERYVADVNGTVSDVGFYEWDTDPKFHVIEHQAYTDLEEKNIMQLAGISTAAMQNTDSTIKDRIDKTNPYWTVAYQDTCDAVDREMKLRKEYADLKHQTDQMREALEFYSKLCWSTEYYHQKENKYSYYVTASSDCETLATKALSTYEAFLKEEYEA